MSPYTIDTYLLDIFEGEMGKEIERLCYFS